MTRMKLLLATALVSAFFPASAALAETTECTVIASVPATLTAQGVYCFKSDLATGITSGAAIEIATNNVTIDMNGFKLGGLAAGPETGATGIFADDRANITLRNGNIRGFREGIRLGGDGSGHLIEDMTLDGNTVSGIAIAGDSVVVRGNRVVNTTGPGTTGLGISGIALESATDSQIVGNVVSATASQTSLNAFAISMTATQNVDVKGNTLLGTTSDSGSSVGLYVVNGTNVVAQDNTLMEGESGAGTATGIFGSSSSLFCRDNVIDGFADGQTNGCTAQTGTHPHLVE